MSPFPTSSPASSHPLPCPPPGYRVSRAYPPLQHQRSHSISSSHPSTSFGLLSHHLGLDLAPSFGLTSAPLHPISEYPPPLLGDKAPTALAPASCPTSRPLSTGPAPLTLYSQPSRPTHADSHSVAPSTPTHSGFNNTPPPHPQASYEFKTEQAEPQPQKPLLPPQTLNSLHPESHSRDVKRRTSKACDHCRKSKCKCTRAPGHDGVVPTTGPCQNCAATGLDCTFNLTSRKRGPPKGYIEAIESRLHRMEYLLGRLLHHDDPRTRALLAELIDDQNSRELIIHDLRAATERGSEAKPRKSWRLADDHEQLQSQTALSVSVSHRQDYGSRASQANPESNPHDVDGDDSCEEPDEPNNSAKAELARVNRCFRRELQSDLLPSLLTSQTSICAPRKALQFRNGDRNLPKAILEAVFDHHQSPKPPGSREFFLKFEGQLSLDHNSQLQYHGPSSGLSLISRFSNHYKHGYWRFHHPGAEGFQADLTQSDGNLGTISPRDSQMAALEIFQKQNPKRLSHLLNAVSVFPTPRKDIERLLNSYWDFVHPILPILNRATFMEQFNLVLQEVESREQSQNIPQEGWKNSHKLTRNQIWLYTIFKSSWRLTTSEISIPLILIIFSLGLKHCKAAGRLGTSGEASARGNSQEVEEDIYLTKAEETMEFFIETTEASLNSNFLNCQTLILLSYRKLGETCLSKSWLYAGMAIRLAQDLSLHKHLRNCLDGSSEVEIALQTQRARQRVWWGCVKLDKHLSSQLGRPVMISERDHDIQFLNEDAVTRDGPGKQSAEIEKDLTSRNDSSSRSTSIGCFNHSIFLSILMHRVLLNLYPTRSSLFANSSDALLTLLDQNMSHWYIDLPRYLKFDPHQSSDSTDDNARELEVSITPQVLTLHSQFYAVLILLHRPFLKHVNSSLVQGDNKLANQNSQESTPESSQCDELQSHAVCTASANAILSAFKWLRRIFGFAAISPLMIYYLFTAGTLFVYNAHCPNCSQDVRLESRANLHLCIKFLDEISLLWPGALSVKDLLVGSVEVKTPGLGSESEAGVTEIGEGACNISQMTYKMNDKKRKNKDVESFEGSVARKKSNLDLKSANRSAGENFPVTTLPGEMGNQDFQGSKSQQEEICFTGVSVYASGSSSSGQKRESPFHSTPHQFEGHQPEPNPNEPGAMEQQALQLPNQPRPSQTRHSLDHANLGFKLDLNDLEFNYQSSVPQNSLNQYIFDYLEYSSQPK